jgi:two-component system, OmpR family, sensor histidine kinase KdpD
MAKHGLTEPGQLYPCMDDPPPTPPFVGRRAFDRGTTLFGWRPLSTWLREGTSHWRECALVIIAVGAVTLIGFPLPQEYYQGLGFIYLLVVILLSLRIHRATALFAGILSVAVWDYVFIPPRWNFAIDKLSDVLLLGPYFVVAIVLSQVTVWIREQAREEHAREQRATTLFHLTRLLAAARTLDEAAANSLRQLESQLGAQTALALFRDDGGSLALHPASGFVFDAKELMAAESAVRLRRPAGRLTGLEADSAGFYLPLLREDRVLGVLGVRLPERSALTPRQRELLEVFVGQLALIVEREHLRAASEREKLLAESAKLHRTLLESVSHELRTPLAVITSALENLRDADAGLRVNLFDEARTATRRLNRLVGNLLDQTRLESGALKPRMNWCDARDIVNAALDDAREVLNEHPLTITVPMDFPLVRADFALTEHALSNLFFNAAQHTPAGTPISVSAGIEDGDARIYFRVADRGPGIPLASRERLFQKFTRGEAARPGGLGLGLALVRGFITAQGGEAVLGDSPGGGATITLYLPHVFPKNLLTE